MSYLNNILLFVILLLYPLFSIGNFNIGLPKIETFEALDYNAAFQNWDIAQDDRGILYFANNNGLLQFDGYDWSIYPLPNKTIVRSIEIDENGVIFCGGQNSFGKFQPDKLGQWEFIPLSNSFSLEFRDYEDVWNMSIYKRKVYFRSSERIYVYSDSFSKVYDDFDFQYLKIIDDRKFCQSANGELYLLDDNSSFTNFERVKGSELLEGALIIDIIKSDVHTTLIATEKHGLFKYKSGLISRTDIQMNDYFIQNEITSLITNENDEIIIGTSFAGLIYLNPDYSVKYHIHRDNGLLSNKVQSIMSDEKSNLWLTLDKGINFIQTNSPFNYIIPDGKLAGIGYAVKIFDDNIYFGTNNGLYYKDWQSKNSDIETFEQYNYVKGSKGQVWGVDVVNEKLILSHHKGASIVSNDRVIPFYQKEGVWLMKSNLNDDSFLAGSYDGIIDFDNNGNDLSFKSKISGIQESSRFIEYDNNGNVWMSHPYRGIYRIVLDENNLEESEFVLYKENNGLPSHLHNHVFKVNDKVVFCGETGIYDFDFETEKFKPYKSLNKILGKDIKTRRLKEDKNGNIWYITEEDIGIITLEDEGLERKFTKQSFTGIKELMNDGWEYIYPYDESNIFIASVEGFIHYNPLKKVTQDTLLHILLNEVHAIGKFDSLLFKGAYFSDNKVLYEQPEDQKIKLEPRFKNFQFKFTAIDDFNNRNKLTYRYKLEGFEDKWSLWDEKTIKEYTRLSPGKYNFTLQAKNINGITSKVLNYKFEIKRPWYKSILAEIIYLLILGFILLSIVRLVRKRMQFLEEVIEKTTTKSEGEIERLKREKIQFELEHKNRELITSTMHLLQKNETMQEIMKNLVEIRKLCEHEPTSLKLRKLLRVVEKDATLNEHWDDLMYHFNEVNDEFFTQLKEKYPSLTTKDLKLCTYLRMNLSTKEIAVLSNVSHRGIDASRYRLRKKLELDGSINLTEFLMKY